MSDMDEKGGGVALQPATTRAGDDLTDNVKLNFVMAFQQSLEHTMRPGFQPNPSLSFQTELRRLAKHDAGANKRGAQPLYEKWYEAAQAIETRLRAVKPGDMSHFQKLQKNNHNFRADEYRCIDAAFACIAEKMGWSVNGNAYLKWWGKVLEEAKDVGAKSVTDPILSIEKEFKRLAIGKSWSTSERHTQMRQLLEEQITARVGVSSQLASWQVMCGLLDIEPAPGSIKKCRAVRTENPPS